MTRRAPLGSARGTQRAATGNNSATRLQRPLDLLYPTSSIPAAERSSLFYVFILGGDVTTHELFCVLSLAVDSLWVAQRHEHILCECSDLVPRVKEAD